MKRFFGAAIAVMTGILLASCGSTKATGDARDTAAYQQNQELGLPSWCRTSFKSGRNKNGYYWKGPIDEAGYYTAGEAKYGDVKTSTSAAELDGKAKIAFHIKEEINAIAQAEAEAAGSSEAQREYKEFQSAVAQVKISGIERVDTFIAPEGTVHVLMFVPDSEIKKATDAGSEFSKRVMEKYIESLDKED